MKSKFYKECHKLLGTLSTSEAESKEAASREQEYLDKRPPFPTSRGEQYKWLKIHHKNPGSTNIPFAQFYCEERLSAENLSMLIICQYRQTKIVPIDELRRLAINVYMAEDKHPHLMFYLMYTFKQVLKDDRFLYDLTHKIATRHKNLLHRSWSKAALLETGMLNLQHQLVSIKEVGDIWHKAVKNLETLGVFPRCGFNLEQVLDFQDSIFSPKEKAIIQHHNQCDKLQQNKLAAYHLHFHSLLKLGKKMNFLPKIIIKLIQNSGAFFSKTTHTIAKLLNRYIKTLAKDQRIGVLSVISSSETLLTNNVILASIPMLSNEFAQSTLHQLNIKLLNLLDSSSKGELRTTSVHLLVQALLTANQYEWSKHNFSLLLKLEPYLDNDCIKKIAQSFPKLKKGEPAQLWSLYFNPSSHACKLQVIRLIGELAQKLHHDSKLILYKEMIKECSKTKSREVSNTLIFALRRLAPYVGAFDYSSTLDVSASLFSLDSLEFHPKMKTICWLISKYHRCTDAAKFYNEVMVSDPSRHYTLNSYGFKINGPELNRILKSHPQQVENFVDALLHISYKKKNITEVLEAFIAIARVIPKSSHHEIMGLTYPSYGRKRTETEITLAIKLARKLTTYLGEDELRGAVIQTADEDIISLIEIMSKNQNKAPGLKNQLLRFSSTYEIVSEISSNERIHSEPERKSRSYR